MKSINLNKYTNELVTIALAIALYILAPYGIRFLDPTAGQYDGVYLQKIAFASFATAWGFGFIKLMLHIPWKVIDEHLENLKTYWKDLSSWQKTVASLWLLSLFVWAFFSSINAMD